MCGGEGIKFQNQNLDLRLIDQKIVLVEPSPLLEDSMNSVLSIPSCLCPSAGVK